MAFEPQGMLIRTDKLRYREKEPIKIKIEPDDVPVKVSYCGDSKIAEDETEFNALKGCSVITAYHGGVSSSRMVEVADFMIAYVDKDIHICGTYDEIFESLRRRKPTLIVHKGGKAEMSLWLRGKMNHNFVFESFDELYAYLEALHDGTVEPDYTRWVFFDKV